MDSTYNNYHFAQDIALLLQAHEASAKSSISIEQLIKRLSGILDESEIKRVKAFFASLIGIDSTKLIPQVAEHFKKQIREAVRQPAVQQGGGISEGQLILLEQGLEKIFSKLAAFLLRVTRRGINDLRELSLLARLDGHKLAHEAQQGQELAYAFDAIIEEVAEKILLIIAEDTHAAYQASGTDLTLVSGIAWAARGGRSEYLALLTEPMEHIQREYSEWFGRSDFAPKLIALRDTILLKSKTHRVHHNDIVEPLVDSIVLGLLFDALVQYDMDSAKTLALFLLENAGPTMREAVTQILPEIIRSPLQIGNEVPNDPTQEMAIAQCHDTYRLFSKKAELTYKYRNELSERYVERDVARLNRQADQRCKALVQVVSKYLQHDIQYELQHAYGSLYLDVTHGGVIEKERSATVLPTLSSKQKILFTNLLTETNAPKEAIVLALVELLGLKLRGDQLPSNVGTLYELTQLAIRSLQDGLFDASDLIDPLAMITEAEFRFKFLISKKDVFPAVRIMERFRAGQGVQRLTRSAANARGSLAILLEGAAGQIFSQETRYRLHMAQHQGAMRQLEYCWRESEKRIRNELEAHAIQKLQNTAPQSLLEVAMFTVKNLDSNSRRQSCLGVCLELLLFCRELKQDVLARTVAGFIKEYMLDECLTLHLEPEALLMTTISNLNDALASVQSNAAAANRELLLAGAGPELAVRFKKDNVKAEVLLSDHFTAAARVARRSVLPSRSAPFQKMEIALRYAEVFELIKQAALRI